MKLMINPFKVTPLVEGGNTIKELMDNVRHAAYEQGQLSLLQQVVDDLSAEMADWGTGKKTAWDTSIIGTFKRIIKEYEAIIEGATQ